MKLVIEKHFSKIYHCFGLGIPQFMLKLEGRKRWVTNSIMSFETTGHNLRLFKDLWPDALVTDNRITDEEEKTAAMDFGQGLIDTPNSDILDDDKERVTKVYDGNYPFRVKPYGFQLRHFHEFKDKKIFALFAEQGTGKTKMEVDIMSYRFLKGHFTGVLILAYPKGVHKQWVDEQIPEHIWSDVKWLGGWWDGGKFRNSKSTKLHWVGKKTEGELQILSMNIEAISGKTGLAALEPFLDEHSGKLLVVVDESQSIKSNSSKRARSLKDNIRPFASERVIMTGTPIAINLVDMWSQFNFLNPDIIGHKYKTSFLAQFCVIGGYENRQVVNVKNLSLFKKLIKPHAFRVLKVDELDLPEKVHVVVPFELSKEQKRAMREIKINFFTQLENGEIVNAASAIAAFIRLQQLTSGFAVTDDDSIVEFKDNPKLDSLKLLMESREGKKIIWCRFNRDIDMIKNAFGDKIVEYRGQTSDKDRTKAKEVFLDPDNGMNIVANTAAMGTGVDGLQTVCRTAIYYSNSFNAIQRWQSEDRIHRIGTTKTVTYFDLVGIGSPDRAILRNLKRKKSMSDMTLDDLRRMIDA